MQTAAHNRLRFTSVSLFLLCAIAASATRIPILAVQSPAALLQIQKLPSAQSGQTVRKRPAPAQPATDPDLERAEDAISKQDWKTAEPLLNAVTAKDPQDFRAWYDLGYVCSSQGKIDDAITAYRKSVAVKPELFEANLNLGLLLAQQGSPEAATYLSKSTQLHPERNPNQGLARAWVAYARYLADKKPADAVNAYQEAVRLDPKRADAHTEAGILMEKNKDYAGAEREFKQAVAIDARSSEALAGLVNVYSETRRLPEAETALREYLKVDPENNSAQVQLGRVLAAEGKPDEAIPLLEGALRKQNDPAALRELAGLHASAKHWDEAAAEYSQLVKVSPNDSDALYKLGTVWMNKRDFDNAEKAFIAAINAKPDSPEVYGNLAVVASENKHYPLAIKALDARAKYAADTPATYFLRATAYDSLHDPKNAIDYYHRFLETANGKFPEQEWQARHRLIAIDPKAKK